MKFVEKIYKTQIDVVTKYVLIVVGYVIFLLFGFPNTTVELGSYVGTIFINLKWIFYLLVLICIAAFLFQNKKISTKSKWLSVAGSDIHIHDTRVYIARINFFPLVIIASLWINDTMAYIIGSLIGKTQMSKISPKKTWEGTIGGIILSIAVIFLLSYYILHYEIFSYRLLIIAAIASTAGTFGDLFESKLKRMAGVKDSGHIMPGHGGFLDRFDSLLAATPFVWLYVYFIMK